MRVSIVADPDWQKGVTVELSGDEALVLFEFLVRTSKAPCRSGLVRAEEFVLFRLEGCLNGSMPVFSPRYRALVEEARCRVALLADGDAQSGRDEDE